MKLGKKLLPFALFLALPLAACNFNVMGGGNGQGGNNSGDNGGGDDVKLSAKAEAQRMASEIFDIDVKDVVFMDFDDIEEDSEYDVASYETSKLTFYAVQYEDEELDYEGIVADVKSYLPKGAKKDSSHSIGEEDCSDLLEEGSWINLQEFYTKENLAYDVVVTYMEAEGESFSYAGIAVFEKSELNEYMKYMEYTEEDDDDDDDDDDVKLSAKVEAQRIASEVFDIDVNDVVFMNFDDINEASEYDVGSYETSKLTFYSVQYEDEELDYEGIVADVKSYLPEGAKKDSSHSIGEEDYSDFLEEGSWIDLQEFYTKENLAYDVLVTYIEGEGESFSFAGIAVFEKSELNEYMKLMEYTEEDDDDDDEEGAGQTFDYSEVSSPVATLGDFTVDCHKVGGEAAPVIQNGEELRMYAGNELTISSKGDAITSIDFYNCDCTSKVGATFAAKSGTLTTTSYGYHWEGNATSVTFTCTKVDDSHKQVHFFAIEINGGESGEGGGGEGDEELTSWPASQIAAVLSGGTSVTVPAASGSSFYFEIDEEYDYDCYVYVFGGDVDAYLSTLEAAGFEVDEDEYGPYAVSSDETLEIDIYDEGEYFVLDIYAIGDEEEDDDEGGGGGGGQGTGDATLVESLTALAKSYAAELYDCSESEITVGDYEDDEDMSDVLVYESEDLVFADIWNLSEEDMAAGIVEILESCIPSEFEYSEEDSEVFDGYYDMWYTDGTSWILIYAVDYGDESEPYTYFSIDFVDDSQVEAYVEYMYEE